MYINISACACVHANTYANTRRIAYVRARANEMFVFRLGFRQSQIPRIDFENCNRDLRVHCTPRNEIIVFPYSLYSLNSVRSDDRRLLLLFSLTTPSCCDKVFLFSAASKYIRDATILFQKLLIAAEIFKNERFVHGLPWFGWIPIHPSFFTSVKIR